MYIPGTTCLHILLAHPCSYYYLLSSQYTVLHIVFYCTVHSLFYLLILFYLYLYILYCVVLHILHCPLSGPDLIYMSLLIIFCIIEYVTNKKNLETNHIRLLLNLSRNKMLVLKRKDSRGFHSMVPQNNLYIITVKNTSYKVGKRGQSSCRCTTGERTIKCIRAPWLLHWKLNFVI